jgi:hypothetical protein
LTGIGIFRSLAKYKKSRKIVYVKEESHPGPRTCSARRPCVHLLLPVCINLTILQQMTNSMSKLISNFAPNSRLMAAAFTLTSCAAAMNTGVGEEECTTGDDDICHHTQHALEIVGLAVA